MRYGDDSSSVSVRGGPVAQPGRYSRRGAGSVAGSVGRAARVGVTVLGVRRTGGS